MGTFACERCSVWNDPFLFLFCVHWNTPGDQAGSLSVLHFVCLFVWALSWWWFASLPLVRANHPDVDDHHSLSIQRHRSWLRIPFGWQSAVAIKSTPTQALSSALVRANMIDWNDDLNWTVFFDVNQVSWTNDCQTPKCLIVPFCCADLWTHSCNPVFHSHSLLEPLSLHAMSIEFEPTDNHSRNGRTHYTSLRNHEHNHPIAHNHPPFEDDGHNGANGLISDASLPCPPPPNISSTHNHHSVDQAVNNQVKVKTRPKSRLQKLRHRLTTHFECFCKLTEVIPSPSLMLLLMCSSTSAQWQSVIIRVE